MNNKISDFLKKQTSASISCVNENNEPYSFSCFYAFNVEDKLLYYKSSPSSYHSKILQQNSKISGTIMPDKLNKLAIRGIQFIGELLENDNVLCFNASSLYHRKFPIANAMAGDIFTIKIYSLKMTNNVLGIMEKLSWERDKLFTEI